MGEAHGACERQEEKRKLGESESGVWFSYRVISAWEATAKDRSPATRKVVFMTGMGAARKSVKNGSGLLKRRAAVACWVK